MLYAAKRVEVQAWPAADLIAAAASNWSALPAEVVAAYGRGDWVFFHNRISISTVQGLRDANKGDMVVMTAPGQFMPLTAEAFATAYESV